MPKLKTHKATAKRFRITKNNKLMRMRAGRTHLRRNKRKSGNRATRRPLSATVGANLKQVKQTAGQSVSN